MGHIARPPLLLWPGMGWANNQGTATLVQTATVLHYWEFLDNNAVDRIEITLPLPDVWAGCTLNSLEVSWATDGTLTSTMALRGSITDYVAGTDLATAGGTVIFENGLASGETITPTGTAHQITRTSLTNSTGALAFSAGADLMRVLIQRRSNHASDTNADGLRLYGMRLELT